MEDLANNNNHENEQCEEDWEMLNRMNERSIIIVILNFGNHHERQRLVSIISIIKRDTVVLPPKRVI